MGRGIALQFKKRFPENNKFYETACKRGDVVPGKMLVFETGTLPYPNYIINFPTKRHWRGASRIEDINNGLEDLVRVIQEYKIESVAVPPLGCGLGGLDWNQVKKCIETALSQLDGVKVIVFEPTGAPPADGMARNRVVPKMTMGRAALISLVRQYLNGLLDPIITLIEIHKLMYFLQVSGEPLRLKYIKGQYGPYALNLSYVFNAIEGHMLSGYADGGDDPNKQIHIVPGADDDARKFLIEHADTLSLLHMKRVCSLIKGFETPFGMELLATVHWVSQHEAKTRDDIVRHTHAWNERKRMFSPRQINIAIDKLIEHNWLEKTS